MCPRRRTAEEGEEGGKRWTEPYLGVSVGVDVTETALAEASGLRREVLLALQFFVAYSGSCTVMKPASRQLLHLVNG